METPVTASMVDRDGVIAIGGCSSCPNLSRVWTFCLVDVTCSLGGDVCLKNPIPMHPTSHLHFEKS